MVGTARQGAGQQEGLGVTLHRGGFIEGGLALSTRAARHGLCSLTNGRQHRPRRAAIVN